MDRIHREQSVPRTRPAIKCLRARRGEPAAVGDAPVPIGLTRWTRLIVARLTLASFQKLSFISRSVHALLASGEEPVHCGPAAARRRCRDSFVDRITLVIGDAMLFKVA